MLSRSGIMSLRTASIAVLIFFSISLGSGILVSSDGFVAFAEDGKNEITAEAFVASDAGKYFQTGDYEKSLDAIQQLLSRYPKDPLLRRYQAISLDRLGQSDKAVEIFKDLLLDLPDHVPTHYFLGQAYLRQGKQKEASSEWQWIVDRQDGSIYQSWAGDSIARLGDTRGVSEVTARIPRLNLIARYGYEYDSNVILKPDDGSVSTSQDHNAGRQVLDLGLRYRAYSRRDLAVDFLYGVSQTIHDDSLNEFNFHSEEFGANIRKAFKAGGRNYVAGLRYDFLMGFLETNLFSVKNRWVVSIESRFSKRTRTVFFDRMMAANYGPDGFDPGRTSRDGFYNDIGVTHYFYSSDFRQYVYLRQEFNSGHARGDNFETIGTTTRIGVHVPFSKKLDLDSSVGLETVFYPYFSSTSVRDSSRRRDLVWDLYTAMTYYLTPQLGLRGFYRWIDGQNQNNLFEYKRHIGGAQLIYTTDFLS